VESRESTDLCELSHCVVALLQPLAVKHNVTLVPAECPSPPTVDVNRAQIEHVLANLIDNAIQAMPEGGEVVTRMGIKQLASPWSGNAKESRYAYLTVEDQGIGISNVDLPKIFDPFFTTKEVGEGTGLGLSLAFGIVREHEGWIDVTSDPDKGSCFTLFLPAAAPVATSSGASAVPDSTDSRSPLRTT
jgi:two-component system NtrC family sensor kinase